MAHYKNISKLLVTVNSTVLTTSQDSNRPGRRRLPHPKTLWSLSTPGWLWRRRWPWRPGTVEQRWPGGARLPGGCGPGCWTDSPHRSCMGSGCRKRCEWTKLNYEHILKTNAGHRGVWQNKHEMSCTWTFSIKSKQQSRSINRNLQSLSTMLAECRKMCACASSYLDTREKASAQMAGQGTKRMAMRPSAAG